MFLDKKRLLIIIGVGTLLICTACILFVVLKKTEGNNEKKKVVDLNQPSENISRISSDSSEEMDGQEGENSEEKIVEKDSDSDGEKKEKESESKSESEKPSEEPSAPEVIEVPKDDNPSPSQEGPKKGGSDYELPPVPVNGTGEEPFFPVGGVD